MTSPTATAGEAHPRGLTPPFTTVAPPNATLEAWFVNKPGSERELTAAFSDQGDAGQRSRIARGRVDRVDRCRTPALGSGYA